MEMKVYVRTPEQMERDHSRYKYILYSQKCPATNWKAFEDRDIFVKWLDKYEGTIIKEHDDHVVIDIPEINHFCCKEKFYNVIEEIYDIIGNFGSGLTWNGMLDGTCHKYKNTIGNVLWNGRMVECKRFFIYKDSSKVPHKCFEVVANG